MKTTYENNQEFNLINKFLHSFRYKKLLEVAEKASLSKSKSLKVLDIGSGTSKSYGVLKRAGFSIEYHAVEVYKELYDQAILYFGANEDFHLHAESVEHWIGKFDGFDLIIAQESFEHMPSLLVSKVIDSIGKSNFGYLLVTVPVEVGPSILIKNLGSFLMGYPRYRQYTWRETVCASVYRLDNVRRHTLGHRGFDWRWLAQVLRLNVKIVSTVKSPSQLIPSFLAPSIGFICIPDSEKALSSQ